MDYLAMQTRVRVLLGETDPKNTYWTPTEIKDMINQSALDVATETQSLLTFKEYSTVASTEQYSLSSDFIQMKDVQIDISATLRKTLARLSFDEYNAVTNGNFIKTGQPAFYKMELGATKTTGASAGLPGDVWLFPVPDAVYTLRIYFYQKPTDLSADADISELQESLHSVVCAHAAMVLCNKSDNQQKMSNLAGLYRSLMDNAKGMLNRQDRVGVIHPKDSMGYATSALGNRSSVRRGRLT